MTRSGRPRAGSHGAIGFVHDLRYTDIPAEARQYARRWLLDLIGVAAGGFGTELSGIIRGHAHKHFGAGEGRARMLFDGRPVSPAGAALAGGMTIDALDGHDGHKLTKGHAGCGVFPAALALSEAEGLDDGEAFLTALVLGYEIGTRAGIALHRTACDYHTSGAWVAVACAALGARSLGLSRGQSREAIGIAEYHGPRSQMMRCIDHPTMLKDGSGWGAMAGVSAAYLAADGFTGAPAVTVEAPEIADIWADLGKRWFILEQYFKPFPVCRWAQPAVRAALDLRKRHGLSSRDIDRIEVTTFHESLRLATRAPQSTEAAQYSTSFPVAVAIARGKVDPEDISGAALHDKDVLRLSRDMRISESDAFNSAFPARRFSQVTLHLHGGGQVTSEPTEASGDPENPAPDAEVRAKFHAYATPVLGAERAGQIEASVDDLGAAPLSRLTDLILSDVKGVNP